MMPDGVRTIFPAAKMQHEDRKNKEDDDGGAEEKHDQEKVGPAGWPLLNVSELLLELMGKLFEAIREMFRVVFVTHVVLDAAPRSCVT